MDPMGWIKILFGEHSLVSWSVSPDLRHISSGPINQPAEVTLNGGSVKQSPKISLSLRDPFVCPKTPGFPLESYDLGMASFDHQSSSIGRGLDS